MQFVSGWFQSEQLSSIVGNAFRMAYAAQLQKHTSPFGQLIASPPGLTAKDPTWVSFCLLDLAHRMNNELSAFAVTPEAEKLHWRVQRRLITETPQKRRLTQQVLNREQANPLTRHVRGTMEIILRSRTHIRTPYSYF